MSPRPGVPADASPLWNAGLVLAAVGLAGYLLVGRGALSWPPRALFASMATVVGCLTLIGPLVVGLPRQEAAGSLGDLVWMACGSAVWAFGLSRWARGEDVRLDWTAPVAPWVLGSVALAAFASGWRIARLRPAWTWTGVAGGLVGAFWIAAGLVDCLAANSARTPGGRSGLLSWFAGA